MPMEVEAEGSTQAWGSLVNTWRYRPVRDTERPQNKQKRSHPQIILCDLIPECMFNKKMKQCTDLCLRNVKHIAHSLNKVSASIIKRADVTSVRIILFLDKREKIIFLKGCLKFLDWWLQHILKIKRLLGHNGLPLKSSSYPF